MQKLMVQVRGHAARLGCINLSSWDPGVFVGIVERGIHSVVSTAWCMLC